MNYSILIVEDEEPIRRMLRLALELEGYSVTEAFDAKEMRMAFSSHLPDLILMDWMLPGVSGTELIKQLKQNPETSAIPIIMLTAKAEEHNKIKGLNLGADDYITKPFSPRELVARIRTVIRRSSPPVFDKVLKVGVIALDSQAKEVTVNHKIIGLTPLEFRLLNFFMKNVNRAYTRPQLLAQVWDEPMEIDERTVDVHIRRLRKALDLHGAGKYIKTVRGAGYKFSEKND